MFDIMVRPALFALVVALAAVPASASAQNWRDQRTPFDGREMPVDGSGVQPFPRLVNAARAAAGGGTYIGSDFDAGSATYRFKFINNGRVTWVDVDGRSGQVLDVEGR